MTFVIISTVELYQLQFRFTHKTEQSKFLTSFRTSSFCLVLRMLLINAVNGNEDAWYEGVARRSLNEMCEVQPVEAVLDTGPALYRVRYSPENTSS